ncbi:aminotransferase class IV [Conexibacter woesei]|uniref:Aminotransferase class IV n=1 Tax=Conexibacter woesei (strain DSM 14684 / CCUG 47730 / CIP 108061 / JCM 11494 / NBRC 100937 / ID131577) TaxID=469383 RepID=D3F546_CONWI|nr:aminotransferase class IV [Conexibacter woesei]ADB48624.1 aminotransferase class IV [Conexibacter woesei DSM 14684]
MTVLRVRIDGQPRAVEDAVIPVTDEGLLRGDGVFEVLRLYAGRVFALDQHLERMERSADGLRLPFDAAAAREDVEVLEATADGADAIVRLVSTRGGRRIALLETVPPMPATVRLATVTFSPSGPLDGCKTLSYAANALATRLAIEDGADQALFVRPDGDVLEGPNFAVFLGFAADAPLVTPPLSAGILDSITRRRLIGLVPVVERPVHAAELRHVEEAFVASTLREVLPVRAIDGRAIGRVPGPRTSDAERAFSAHVAQQTATFAATTVGEGRAPA